MSSKIDFKELDAFAKRLEDAKKLDIDKFLKQSTKELAGRLIAKAIRNTPTGKYPASTGKVGGTLKRAWTVGKLRKDSSGYVVDVSNPIHYASYVEYGHHTRNRKAYRIGRYMMTRAISEMNAQAPALLDKKFSRFIQNIAEGKK